MSFDQDPNEQAQVSAADFDMMCDEMKELRKQRDKLLDVLEYAYNNRDTRHTQHDYDSKYDSNCCDAYFGKPCSCHVETVEKTLAAAIASVKGVASATPAAQPPRLASAGPTTKKGSKPMEHQQATLRRAIAAMSAFTDPEGNMPADTGEFRDLKEALSDCEAALLTMPDVALIAADSAEKARAAYQKEHCRHVVPLPDALNAMIAEAVSTEREACAADCDAAAARLQACPSSPENRAAISALERLAAAIRARGSE